MVAKTIFPDKSERQVEIGSRVDGFIAHVVSFRSLEVFDIRQVSSEIPGIIVKRADLLYSDSVTRLCSDENRYCDSLSCLDAIERLGLGRYGDPVIPLGYHRCIEKLPKLLRTSGKLYLSTRIGRERVEFNANQVFSPRTILDAVNSVGLSLNELTILDQQGGHEKVNHPTLQELETLAIHHYRLGIFTSLKRAKSKPFPFPCL